MKLIPASHYPLRGEWICCICKEKKDCGCVNHLHLSVCDECHTITPWEVFLKIANCKCKWCQESVKKRIEKKIKEREELEESWLNETRRNI